MLLMRLTLGLWFYTSDEFHGDKTKSSRRVLLNSDRASLLFWIMRFFEYFVLRPVYVDIDQRTCKWCHEGSIKQLKNTRRLNFFRKQNCKKMGVCIRRNRLISTYGELI